MNRPDREWIGRRWFEMRAGYGTYLGFIFGFGNFVLILHGLTDWFKDYPLHWFALAAIGAIVPAAIAVGYHHNRTQQKTEARNLTHLNPYIDVIVHDSKEEFAYRILLTQIAWMVEMAQRYDDPDLAERTERIGRACRRILDGESSMGALRKEGL